MRQYKKPELHFGYDTGGLCGDDMTKQSEDQQETARNQGGRPEDTKKYQIKSGFILREIAGEYAIIPVDEASFITNAVMSPNESAVFLWKAFQHPSTIQEVVQQGLQEYEVAEEIIRASTVRFVEELLQYRILEEVTRT